MNPQESTLALKNSLIEYFKQAFPLEKALTGEGKDPANLLGKIDDFLNNNAGLVQPPYIERQVPYRPSERSLDKIGLAPETAKAFAGYFGVPADKFHPYVHQENAFEQVSKGRNLVICTGTGSGKTESFLLPVIDAIVNERREKGAEYQSGVRALILYPMNALVNDQIRRLRAIIRNIDPAELRPTFGLYTSEIKPHEDVQEVTEALAVWNDLTPDAFVGETDEADYANDNIALPCEYTHRYQWDKPADILVTNYSMLERLLLNPATKQIFSPTWRFIVLDEAHSYTGSTGTEIAWLIRRLAHRTGAERLQYIAASATLRKPEAGETEERNKQWIRENFASQIFPAEAGTFAVELGASADPDTTERAGCCDGDPAQLIREDHAFDDLIKLLSEEKSNQDDRALDPYLGKSSYSVDELALLLDKYPGLEPDEEVVRINDNIRRLIGFVLAFFGQTDDDWKDKLHDDLSPLDSERQDRQGNRIHQGNRLCILDDWKEAIRNAAAPLSVEAFSDLVFYAYQAANEIDGFKVDLGKLKVEVTDEFRDETEKFKKDIDDKKQELDKRRAELTAQWATLLGTEPDGRKLEGMLFDRLCNRADTRYIVEHVASKPVPFMDIARKVYCGVDDEGAAAELFALLQLGLIAQKQGVRHPLLNIRYHQLIRGVSDVAVSFPDGRVESLEIVRSADFEYEGNNLFALGVCRECGQPYLMGYTADPRITGDGRLLRNYTVESPWLQVFAWAPGSDAHAEEKGWQQAGDDAELKQKDKDKVGSNGSVYLNLRTGEYSLDKKNDDYVRMYWSRHFKGTQSSLSRFITACPNCGCWRKTDDRQTYGIITPYEAVSDQVRLQILTAFAKQAEADTDPRLRDMPGGGRKVLAFSDSRSGAASLAYKFHNLFLAEFLTREIASIVNDRENFIPPWEKRVGDIEITRPEVWKMIGDRIRGRSEEDVRNDPQMNLLPLLCPQLFEGEIQSNLANVAAVLLREMQEKKFDFFLEVQDEENPSRLLNAKSAACWLTIRALRDLARLGLIGGKKIELEYDFESHGLENAIEDWRLERFIPDDEMRKKFKEEIPGLLQNIFRFLFVNCPIEAPKNWPAIDDHEDWNRPVDLEQKYDAEGRVEFIGFRPKTNRRHRILDCLKEVLDKVGLQLSFEQQRDFLKKIWDYLCGEAGVLCKDNASDGRGLSLLAGGDGDLQEFARVMGSTLAASLILKPGKNAAAAGAAAEFPLRIEEHTAQLTSKRGSSYQKAFASGRINILSCSTTFEMGIDLGGLNRVFLANMPPATSNYKQRAGRAGRRPGAAAYILTFSGAQSHDLYYFERPTELFDGEITPPRIYLDKPTFRARHLRAEALHAFLEYWVGKNPPPQNGYHPWRDWTGLNAFFLHYETTRLDRESKTAVVEKNGSPIIAALPAWFATQGQAVQDDILGMLQETAGIRGLDYSVPKDLIFQLTGNNPPYEMRVEKRHDFLNLCGPCLPEKKDDGTFGESENPMRQCALSRVNHKFVRLRSDGADDYGFINDHGVKRINGSQKYYLRTSSIDALSSYSVLPKYGFPVDIIELSPGKGDRSRENVSLERDLRIGLYEYAPGQQVFADRRRYKSTEFSFHGEHKLSYKQCPRCNLFTDQNTCPVCGADTVSTDKRLKFVRPDAFYTGSGDSFGKFLPEKRGLPQQIYAGDILAKSRVAGLNLWVGESDTQMMRYINGGADGKGFEHGGKVKNQKGKGKDQDKDQEKYVFFHEIITNIAIWEIPKSLIPAVKFPAPGNDHRVENAVRSAMYAIREAAAIKLQVSSRDIGVLLDPLPPGDVYRIVLFDEAAGGGGLVLPLYDAGNSTLIRGILVKAQELCSKCSCGGGTEPTPDIRPVSEKAFGNALQNNNGGLVRPRAACPLCLKKPNNFLDHHRLDRWDAAHVLDLVLTPPEPKWVPVPAGFVPHDGRPYKLDDDSVITLDRRHHPEHRDLIARIKYYREA